MTGFNIGETSGNRSGELLISTLLLSWAGLAVTPQGSTSLSRFKSWLKEHLRRFLAE